MCFTDILFGNVLLLISLQDIKERKISNKYQGLLLILAIVKIVLLERQQTLEHLTGAIVISVPMLTVALLFRGTIGGGDIKLMCLAGLYIGRDQIIRAAVVGLLLAGMYAMYLIVCRCASGKTKFPLGPFLCVGIAAVEIIKYIE